MIFHYYITFDAVLKNNSKRLRVVFNMIVLALICAYLAFELLFFIFHKKPLNEKEIKKLSEKRKRKYIKHNYNFVWYNLSVNKTFKSSMKPSGNWYDVREELRTFPSLISALLKGKKHEWVVIAIENNCLIYGFYANKGVNNSTVSFNCDFQYLINKCEQYNCNTIMRFHNHPNENPKKQTCLLASKQDFISAESCADIVNSKYNWLDFVCERGKFIKFYEKYSPNFLPDCAKIENIASKNNISKFNNYKLHRELGIFH